MTHQDVVPRVVYIAGYGRSGSTLLDTLLGNHPTICGVGELYDLLRGWQQNERCACGEPLRECGFWARSMGQLQSAWPDLDLAMLDQVTKRIEYGLLVARPTPAARIQDQSLYGRFWRGLMIALWRTSGCGIILDSSKTSRACSHRISALRNFGNLDVQVIHLVRNPRAVIYSSAIRGSNIALKAGVQRRPYSGVLRPLFGWALANQSVHLIAARNSGLPVYRVRYEDLAREPARVLLALGTFLDVDMVPITRAIAEGKDFSAAHGVSGNRMRHAGAIQIREDVEWRQKLPAYANWLAALLWPLAQHYGY